jgi:GNAT superfamily N-acetyltransferase
VSTVNDLASGRGVDRRGEGAGHRASEAGGSRPVFAVTQGGRSRAFATLVEAFRDDPVERWLYPDDEGYERHFPAFIEALGGRAIDGGTAWRLGDFDAIALWMAPGAEPDGSAIESVLRATVPSALHLDVFATLAEMDAAHPRAPHWYLPWLGVRPELSGRGLGAGLLRHGLAEVDRAGLPAYLETPNPRTVPFYERHGFVVTGGTRNRACPPLTFMERPSPGRAG